MRIAADGPATLSAIYEGLVRVPEEVRAFALEHIAVFVVGGETNGKVSDRRYVDTADHIVTLLARDGMMETFLHEVAHAYCKHEFPCEQDEREAAALVATWGFSGHSADPDACATAFRPRRLPTIHARLSEDGLALECGCGGRCRVLCPTVVGREADLVVECRRCAWVEMVTLKDLVPCTCGAHVEVAWAPGATPSNPVADWSCSCGQQARRTILSAQDHSQGDPRLSYCDALLVGAVRRLEAVGRLMRQLGPVDEDRHAMAITSWVGTLTAAQSNLVKAVREMEPGDPRQEQVAALCSRLREAAEAIPQPAAADAITDAVDAIRALQRAEHHAHDSERQQDASRFS